MVFLAAENEDRLLKGLPQAVFDHIRGNIYSFGKEKVNNCEFWEFCAFLHLEPYCALRFFLTDCETYNFIL